MIVAGPGFEPGSSGYEPDEIPLLYPAMMSFLRHRTVYKILGEKSSLPFSTGSLLNNTRVTKH